MNGGEKMLSYNEDARLVSCIFKACMFVMVFVVCTIAKNEGEKIGADNVAKVYEPQVYTAA